MNEATMYPEDESKLLWNEDINAVSGASIKIIDTNTLEYGIGKLVYAFWDERVPK